MTRTSRRALARPVLALVLMGAACSARAAAPPPGGTPSPRPSSPARLAILSPKNGQVIRGSEVKIRVRLRGARIVPATTTHVVPDQGHLHVYLDNRIVSMNFQLTDDLRNLSPGMHVLRVEFVASDHLPFDPRVFTAVTFEVKP